MADGGREESQFSSGIQPLRDRALGDDPTLMSIQAAPSGLSGNKRVHEVGKFGKMGRIW